MEYQEIKTKTADELSQLVLNSKKELFNLRFQKAASAGLEKTHRAKQVRKVIARAKTAQTQLKKQGKKG
ncbi:MAG TPA: 50S ribosomal protein L29 [Alphaproteobacteria bacterium]|nr:50S ribosomal protein L29 [Alphaproteobacteria bacterium]